MSTKRKHGHHRARVSGIILLILGLAHAPLPRADFHNVRHHDSAGEVCELHDHLLRWHPDAGRSEDVAILHWHWMLPWSTPDDPGHSGDRPALHANADGWDATSPDPGPSVTPDLGSRPLIVEAPAASIALDATVSAPPIDAPGSRTGLMGPVHAFGATFARRGSLAAWLQRWSC